MGAAHGSDIRTWASAQTLQTLQKRQVFTRVTQGQPCTRIVGTMPNRNVTRRPCGIATYTRSAPTGERYFVRRYRKFVTLRESTGGAYSLKNSSALTNQSCLSLVPGRTRNCVVLPTRVGSHVDV